MEPVAMLYCLCNRIIYVCTHARGLELAYFVTTLLQELIEICALTKRRCYKMTISCLYCML